LIGKKRKLGQIVNHELYETKSDSQARRFMAAGLCRSDSNGAKDFAGWYLEGILRIWRPNSGRDVDFFQERRGFLRRPAGCLAENDVGPLFYATAAMDTIRDTTRFLTNWVSSWNHQDWFVALAMTVVVGAMMLRGFGSRSNY
jgi:sucrose-6-phosphate hydrolase SacC (GH32 family)